MPCGPSRTRGSSYIWSVAPDGLGALQTQRQGELHFQFGGLGPGSPTTAEAGTSTPSNTHPCELTGQIHSLQGLQGDAGSWRTPPGIG